MSTVYLNCGDCNRPENACICGRKKGYFKCVVCEGDLLPKDAKWATQDQPVHESCLQAVMAEASALQQQGTERPPMKAVTIPLQYELQVPLEENEDPTERIRFAVSDFLSNVILAFNGATFAVVTEADYPEQVGQIRVRNFKLPEILAAAQEQERTRRERLEKERE